MEQKGVRNYALYTWNRNPVNRVILPHNPTRELTIRARFFKMSNLLSGKSRVYRTAQPRVMLQ